MPVKEAQRPAGLTHKVKTFCLRRNNQSEYRSGHRGHIVGKFRLTQPEPACCAERSAKSYTPSNSIYKNFTQNLPTPHCRKNAIAFGKTILPRTPMKAAMQPPSSTHSIVQSENRIAASIKKFTKLH
jgi:hypothetical protein